jgi:GTP cyclohydrolase III
MGEFAAAATDGVALTDLIHKHLQQRLQRRVGMVVRCGLACGRTMQTPMQNLYTAQTATVNACP